MGRKNFLNIFTIQDLKFEIFFGIIIIYFVIVRFAPGFPAQFVKMLKKEIILCQTDCFRM